MYNDIFLEYVGKLFLHVNIYEQVAISVENRQSLLMYLFSRHQLIKNNNLFGHKNTNSSSNHI